MKFLPQLSRIFLTGTLSREHLIVQLPMSETVYAQWTIDKSQHRFWIGLVITTAATFFLLSFFLLYIVTQTTELLLAFIPILSLLLLLGLFPEAVKSWGAVEKSGQVYVTEKGLYLRNLSKPEDYKFVSWENIAQYDLKYFNSVSPLGKIFSRPTKFFLKGKYEEDSFTFDAFGEDVDVVRAYLKEKNVNFGFIKK